MNEKIIKEATHNDFNLMKQKQIKEVIRTFNIEQRHILELKKAFMECEFNSKGETTLGELLENLQEMNYRYP